MPERLRLTAPPELAKIVRYTLADEWVAPFWKAAAEHRLICPQCKSCGTFRMPPVRFCWNCQSQDIQWVELPGTGTVYSYTVVVHPLRPDLADYVPYVPALVEPDEAPGVRLITNVVDCEPEEIHVGLRVRVLWDRIDDTVVIPRFTPNRE